MRNETRRAPGFSQMHVCPEYIIREREPDSLHIYTIFLKLFKLASPGCVLLVSPKDPKAKDTAKALDSTASQAGPSCHGLLVIAPYSFCGDFSRHIR